MKLREFNSIGSFTLTPRGKSGAVLTIPAAWLADRCIDPRKAVYTAYIKATDRGRGRFTLIVEVNKRSEELRI